MSPWDMEPIPEGGLYQCVQVYFYVADIQSDMKFDSSLGKYMIVKSDICT